MNFILFNSKNVVEEVGLSHDPMSSQLRKKLEYVMCCYKCKHGNEKKVVDTCKNSWH